MTELVPAADDAPMAAAGAAETVPTGEPSVGESAVCEPAVGEPAVGEPAVGEPAVGEPAVGEPAVGEPNAGGPAATEAEAAEAEVAEAVEVNAATTAGGAVEPVPPSASLTRARAVAKLAADSQATDVTILDLRKRTALFDFFIVATGKSGRQLRAIADEVDDLLQKQLGEKRLHIDGYQDSRWIVLDYGDLVIHLFDREMRDFYRIEDLWSDAPRVPLS